MTELALYGVQLHKTFKHSVALQILGGCQEKALKITLFNLSFLLKNLASSTKILARPDYVPPRFWTPSYMAATMEGSSRSIKYWCLYWKLCGECHQIFHSPFSKCLSSALSADFSRLLRHSPHESTQRLFLSFVELCSIHLMGVFSANYCWLCSLRNFSSLFTPIDLIF